ncbi:hypothetical protein [Halomonas sp. M20]|uniref:hypothetical protein n=1 Tax=Halomonas sp. M20 TaxID=2763264 RepID=UPI001D0BD124|nr:hypothetical protein [Halomonas sp. M20]
MNVYKRKIFKLIDLFRIGGRPGRHEEVLSRLLKKNKVVKDYTYLTDPLQAFEKAKGEPFLTSVPLARCRSFGLLAFPITKDSSHPFIQTLNEYKKTGLRRYEGSPLEKYYSSFRPANGIDLWGIKPSKIDRLAKYSILDFIEPWFGIPSKHEKRSKININKMEAHEHNRYLKSALDWQHFGPVSYEKGKFEYERLINIYDSIKKHGYLRDEGHSEINGVLLVAGKKYSVIINSGQHRIAALLANDYEIVPIYFNTKKWQPVIRSKAHHWPAVKYNFLSEQEAKIIFDRILSGLQPFTNKLAKKWTCNGQP